jgi:enoyl-[acyl-carrier protein] reductase I
MQENQRQEEKSGMSQKGLMSGKRGLIMGVANDHSLAWGISQQLAREGAQLAFTYQGEILKRRVEPLAHAVGSDIVLPCDVTIDADIDHVFDTLGQQWETIDFIVHAIGFSDKEELKGKYVYTSRANFLRTMDISCYSFTAVCQKALPFMREKGGSILTLTYYGAERVMPHYNVMGPAKAALEASVRYLAVDLGEYNIRVNALSAGPVKTLAASGIGDFRYILKWNQYNAPLRRNVTQEEVGKAGLYLLSDLSSAVSGETHHVDCGYHVVGMKAIDAPDMTVAKAAHGE